MVTLFIFNTEQLIKMSKTEKGTISSTYSESSKLKAASRFVGILFSPFSKGALLFQ